MRSLRRARRARRPLLALLALAAALGIGYGVRAADSGPSSGSSHVPAVALSALPAQAAQTVALLESGAPLPGYRDEGVVFHNYEHRLPSEPDGYYHEFTVPTPGSADRGARRIVTGEHGEYFYTGDHYETFERIRLP